MNHVDFEMFGKPRKMKLGLDEVANIEKELGIGLFQLMKSEKLGINAMCCVIGAGLRFEDSSFTTAKVRRWVEKYINENPGESLITVIPKLEDKIMEMLEKSGLLGDIIRQDDDFGGTEVVIKNAQTETAIPSLKEEPISE